MRAGFPQPRSNSTSRRRPSRGRSPILKLRLGHEALPTGPVGLPPDREGRGRLSRDPTALWVGAGSFERDNRWLARGRTHGNALGHCGHRQLGASTTRPPLRKALEEVHRHWRRRSPSNSFRLRRTISNWRCRTRSVIAWHWRFSSNIKPGLIYEPVCREKMRIGLYCGKGHPLFGAGSIPSKMDTTSCATPHLRQARLSAGNARWPRFRATCKTAAICASDRRDRPADPDRKICRLPARAFRPCLGECGHDAPGWAGPV